MFDNVCLDAVQYFFLEMDTSLKIFLHKNVISENQG